METHGKSDFRFLRREQDGSSIRLKRALKFKYLCFALACEVSFAESCLVGDISVSAARSRRLRAAAVKRNIFKIARQDGDKKVAENLHVWFY